MPSKLVQIHFFFIGKSENAIWDPWLEKKNCLFCQKWHCHDGSRRKVKFCLLKTEIWNCIFWPPNKKTNWIWTNLEEIGDDCGRFKSPFLGVCPELPWRPPNPLMLLNCSPILPHKHMIDWRHLLLGKCEILRMAAHFSPSCLGLMGNLGNPLALFFDYNLPIFFSQVGHWRSKLAISEEKKITS